MVFRSRVVVLSGLLVLVLVLVTTAAAVMAVTVVAAGNRSSHLIEPVCDWPSHCRN